MTDMVIDSNFRKSWEKMQQRYDHPVYLDGQRISKDDKLALTLWKESGIDLHMLPAGHPVRHN